MKIAQQMHTKHRDVLRRVEKTYGVSSRIVVSVWGLESNFGRFAGVRPTIPALVTLAYDPRRGAMFRDELFSALQIVNRGDIPLERLKGSWAGALGQPQFMPSSYLEYAQDFDGDGTKDIWTSQADVFASIAFYLQQHGWKAGEAWGREVQVPSLLKEATLAIPRREAGCRAQRLMTEPRPVSEWRTMGLRTTSERDAASLRHAGVDGGGGNAQLSPLRQLRGPAGLQLRAQLCAQRRSPRRPASLVCEPQEHDAAALKGRAIRCPTAGLPLRISLSWATSTERMLP